MPVEPSDDETDPLRGVLKVDLNGVSAWLEQIQPLLIDPSAAPIRDYANAYFAHHTGPLLDEAIDMVRNPPREIVCTEQLFLIGELPATKRHLSTFWTGGDGTRVALRAVLTAYTNRPIKNPRPSTALALEDDSCRFSTRPLSPRLLPFEATMSNHKALEKQWQQLLESAQFNAFVDERCTLFEDFQTETDAGQISRLTDVSSRFSSPEPFTAALTPDFVHYPSPEPWDSGSLELWSAAREGAEQLLRSMTTPRDFRPDGRYARALAIAGQFLSLPELSKAAATLADAAQLEQDTFKPGPELEIKARRYLEEVRRRRPGNADSVRDAQQLVEAASAATLPYSNEAIQTKLNLAGTLELGNRHDESSDVYLSALSQLQYWKSDNDEASLFAYAGFVRNTRLSGAASRATEILDGLDTVREKYLDAVTDGENLLEHEFSLRTVRAFSDGSGTEKDAIANLKRSSEGLVLSFMVSPRGTVRSALIFQCIQEQLQTCIEHGWVAPVNAIIDRSNGAFVGKDPELHRGWPTQKDLTKLVTRPAVHNMPGLSPEARQTLSDLGCAPDQGTLGI